uniref:Rab-like protein n=1 Tax=Trepomonas sp. PC1 TaxID=1076344 RepID=A0A146JXS2_9EUKA|eukprot:JAP89472.1 Hypothetical protein TPC1_31033 [Trepomonas sp. PC1]
MKHKLTFLVAAQCGSGKYTLCTRLTRRNIQVTYDPTLEDWFELEDETTIITLLDSVDDDFPALFDRQVANSSAIIYCFNASDANQLQYQQHFVSFTQAHCKKLKSTPIILVGCKSDKAQFNQNYMQYFTDYAKISNLLVLNAICVSSKSTQNITQLKQFIFGLAHRFFGFQDLKINLRINISNNFLKFLSDKLYFSDNKIVIQLKNLNVLVDENADIKIGSDFDQGCSLTVSQFRHLECKCKSVVTANQLVDDIEVYLVSLIGKW